jgi:uncharacterized iron-regulated membrane protein
VVGAIGIGLLLMSLSGLFIWLMSKPRWRHMVHFTTGGPLRRTMFEMHRSIGLIAMLVIVVQAFTGVWLSYPNTLRASLGWFVPVEVKQKTKVKKHHGRSGEASIPALLLAAASALPDGIVSELRLPDTDGKPVEVRMWRTGDIRSTGNNAVTLNPSDARVISIERFVEAAPAQKLIDWVTPIHYGEWGGLASRVLLGLIGIAPPALFFSGILIWRKPKRLRAKQAQSAEAEDAVPLVR